MILLDFQYVLDYPHDTLKQQLRTMKIPQNNNLPHK